MDRKSGGKVLINNIRAAFHPRAQGLAATHANQEPDSTSVRRPRRQHPLRQIVTHSFPLGEAPQAFEHFRMGADACRILILPNS
jgi:hypothetical protein